jgi:hypothetical protein
MMNHSGIFGPVQGAALSLVLALASCAPNSQESRSGSAAYGVERLCSGLGFAPGSEAFASCIAKLEGLAREQADNQKQCEGIRQRALSMPAPAGGFGNVIATSDADYQSCMSGQLAPPVQLEPPTGRTLTCRMIEQQIACG